MPFRAISRSANQIVKLGMISIVTLLALVIAWLSLHVTQDLLSLRRTPHGDLVWVGTQMETQLHRLQSSLALAKLGRTDEAEVEKQWVGLQGWQPMLTTGVLYEYLSQDPQFRDLTDKITTGLDTLQNTAQGGGGWVATADANLALTASLSPVFRHLAVYVVQKAGEIEHEQHDRILRDARLLGAVIILLFLILAGASLLAQIQAQRLREAGRALDRSRLEAERASRAKSDFVAHMSHEFRTPLNAIIGFSEAIQAEIFGPVGHPRYREYCGDVVTAGRHLHGLIDAILDLSRIESGKTETEPAEIEPLGLAHICLDLVRPQANKKNIQLILAAEANLPKLTADPRHLRQILINLLSNAVKFTPDNGRVELAITLGQTTETNEAFLAFSVTDNGVGISAEDLERVQRPFGRVRRSKGQAQDGTGLGLSISRSLAEANGAGFHLASEKGVGTTAVIRFPLIKHPHIKSRD